MESLSHEKLRNLSYEARVDVRLGRLRGLLSSRFAEEFARGVNAFLLSFSSVLKFRRNYLNYNIGAPRQESVSK